MIRTESITSIPDLEWSDYSSQEFSLVPSKTRKQLVSASSPVRLFADEGGVLMVAGLYRASLLAAPHFWALLTRHFVDIARGDIRQLIRFLDEIPGQVETYIEEDNARAAKLARLFRFAPTERAGQVGSMTMRLYRRV